MIGVIEAVRKLRVARAIDFSDSTGSKAVVFASVDEYDWSSCIDPNERMSGCEPGKLRERIGPAAGIAEGAEAHCCCALHER